MVRAGPQPPLIAGLCVLAISFCLALLEISFIQINTPILSTSIHMHPQWAVSFLGPIHTNQGLSYL